MRILMFQLSGFYPKSSTPNPQTPDPASLSEILRYEPKPPSTHSVYHLCFYSLAYTVICCLYRYLRFHYNIRLHISILYCIWLYMIVRYCGFSHSVTYSDILLLSFLVLLFLVAVLPEVWFCSICFHERHFLFLTYIYIHVYNHILVIYCYSIW